MKYIKNFHQFDLHFKKHCEEGKLPNYVVIEQRYFDLLSIPGNDDHPSHDISEGQRFVKEVYETLRASPQWNEMLFLILYDEHGGFYDHVPTPTDGVPSPDDIVGPAPYNFHLYFTREAPYRFHFPLNRLLFREEKNIKEQKEVKILRERKKEAIFYE